MSPQLATELYAEIARHLAREDLLALAAACHKLNDVANRLLYARIELDGKPTRRETAISLLSALRDKRLACLPRHIELHWLAPPKARDQASLPAELIAVVLPTLTNITFLSISPSLEMYGWVFDNLTLPSLLQFHSYGPAGISWDFIERHPQLTHLTIGQRHAGRFQLKRDMAHLVYLRTSCVEILEQLLRRQTPPTLERIVFGLERVHHLRTLISAVTSYPWLVPHVDIVGRNALLPFSISGGLALPAAHRVTSLGLAACEYVADTARVPRREITIDFLRNLQHLFPAIKSLAIHCAQSAHEHSTMVALSLDDFIGVLHQVDGLQHVDVTEYLGTRVIPATRNGQRYSECVPTGQRKRDYQLIPWPEC